MNCSWKSHTQILKYMLQNTSNEISAEVTHLYKSSWSQWYCHCSLPRQLHRVGRDPTLECLPQLSLSRLPPGTHWDWSCCHCSCQVVRKSYSWDLVESCTHLVAHTEPFYTHTGGERKMIYIKLHVDNNTGRGGQLHVINVHVYGGWYLAHVHDSTTKRTREQQNGRQNLNVAFSPVFSCRSLVRFAALSLSRPFCLTVVHGRNSDSAKCHISATI